MNVLFIPTSNSGVSYWRMYNFWDAAYRNRAFDSHVMWWQWNLMETHPWELRISEQQYQHTILGELDAYVKKADIVVMQMAHTQMALNIFKGIKEMYKIPVVVESDDNYLSTPTYNPASTVYQPGTYFMDVAKAQFRAADAIVCSTQYLADLYKDFCPYTYVVPNCIDFNRWKIGAKNKPGIRIGWAGGASHNEDLAILRDVIPEVIAKHKRAKFVLVHGVPDFLRGLPGVVHVNKWTPIKKYPRFISSLDFDIALAPLRDNAFNRGKSNLRWLEAASLGVPCVASNVGHFAETIKNGEDGLIADSPQEWIHRISMLITDKKIRSQIGNNARNRVLKDFNVDNVIFDYAKILDEVHERGSLPLIEEKRSVDWNRVKAGTIIPVYDEVGHESLNSEKSGS